jgi:LemA protein
MEADQKVAANASDRAAMSEFIHAATPWCRTMGRLFALSEAYRDLIAFLHMVYDHVVVSSSYIYISFAGHAFFDAYVIY